MVNAKCSIKVSLLRNHSGEIIHSCNEFIDIYTENGTQKGNTDQNKKGTQNKMEFLKD